MSTCPCCLEELKPAFLGLGGRRLAPSACELCGERVCEACLHAALLEAREVAGARPGLPRRRAHACGSCLWARSAERGERPPSFPEPAAHRRRRAQAACPHPRRVRWMMHCPDCGAPSGWAAEGGNPECDACGAPSHAHFNCCFACGESFGEENPAQETAEGYALDYGCGDDQCGGRVAWLMPHCPWCGTPQHWPPSGEGEAGACTGCEAPLESSWAFCAACGEEAPVPERCTRCALPLVRAECAARCEACREMVCGDCFDTLRVPGTDAEALLCTDCGERLGATAPEPEPAPDAEEAPPGEEPEEEAADEEAPDDAEAPGPEEAAAPPEPEVSVSAWEVLGVAPGTPLSEVKRAYLALVAQYHPDKVAQLGPKLQALALEETRKLNLAWAELRGRAG